MSGMTVEPDLAPIARRVAPRRQVFMLAGGGVAHTSGGVGTLLLYLMSAWANTPNAPSVRVLDTRGQGGAAAGVFAFIRAVATLSIACMTGSVSVVHAHMTERGSVWRKCILCGIANLLNVPTVVHQHGAGFHDYFRRQPAPIRWAIRATLARARRVVVLGGAWRDFLTREVGVDPRNITIVMNGVPRPASLAAGREPFAPVRILFLGRLGERKGVPELIAALAKPHLRDRNWQATIAGDGETARFRAEVERVGLSPRVSVPGWQDRAATESLLCQADILVLPSHHEAMPVAVIEALAHRVAVITTPVGVVPEFLHDDIDALLVPPGDTDRLSDAILRLIDDPEARARLAEAGHETFTARLEIEAVAAQITSIYREIDARR